MPQLGRHPKDYGEEGFLGGYFCIEETAMNRVSYK